MSKLELELRCVKSEKIERKRREEERKRRERRAEQQACKKMVEEYTEYIKGALSTLGREILGMDMVEVEELEFPIIKLGEEYRHIVATFTVERKKRRWGGARAQNPEDFKVHLVRDGRLGVASASGVEIIDSLEELDDALIRAAEAGPGTELLSNLAKFRAEGERRRRQYELEALKSPYRQSGNQHG